MMRIRANGDRNREGCRKKVGKYQQDIWSWGVSTVSHLQGRCCMLKNGTFRRWWRDISRGYARQSTAIRKGTTNRPGRTCSHMAEAGIRHKMFETGLLQQSAHCIREIGYRNRPDQTEVMSGCKPSCQSVCGPVGGEHGGFESYGGHVGAGSVHGCV